MAEIAILGFGTVGSGVFETIKTNQASIDKRAKTHVQIKKILDLRDFPGSPIENILTKDFNDILNDDQIKIVVEVMGGVEPAYTYAKSALMRGKSVITSNKELVAKHGAELLNLAMQKKLNFLFEASVGGGIPIIRPLNKSLAADEISEITGILNGTTNYIISQMLTENKSFDEALSEAQEKGYAEKDPTADIMGFDTCRKIAILLSLAIGSQVDYEDIYTEGITNITKTDLAYAQKICSTIKLMAIARIIERGVYAMVCPVIIKSSHPMANVDGVYNAIFVRGNVIDEVMFYGKGAGKFPTASAVVADIVDAMKHLSEHIPHIWSTEKLDIMPIDNVPVKKLIRVLYSDTEKNRPTAIESAKRIFGNAEIIELHNITNEFAFITDELTEREAVEKTSLLREAPGVSGITNSIRLY